MSEIKRILKKRLETLDMLYNAQVTLAGSRLVKSEYGEAHSATLRARAYRERVREVENILRNLDALELMNDG